jgi:hypothetical protein
MKMTFKPINYALAGILLINTIGCNLVIEKKETRDPLAWPFSQTSIWNMPIGDSAIYVAANLEPAEKERLTLDEDIIVLTPKDSMLDIYENFADWNPKRSRCVIEGNKLYQVPFPKDFIYSPDNWEGGCPNAGLASLMPDGRTIKQTQPFARCFAGKPGTSHYLFPDQDIYGEGYYGAHGGSGLSAIGGALRVGELLPESGPIRHSMKINIWAGENIHYDTITKGYRWPALRADGYAARVYGKLKRSTPFIEAVRIGALLAMPARMNLDSLQFETKPGRILAEAFKDYGAYVVDDTYRDAWALITSWEANGRFAEEFKKGWGYSFATTGIDNEWARDVEKIFKNLYVIDNNAPKSIGGGGKPRRPLAPPFNKSPE